MQRKLAWPATQTATDNTYRTRITHKCRQTCPLILWGWQRQKVTSAGTHITSPGFTSTCMFVGPLSTGMAPLSVRYPCPDPGPLTRPTGPLLTGWSSLMHQTCSIHTIVPQAPHTHRFSLGTSTDSAHLITLPGPPTHWLTGWSSFKFSGEYRFTPPTHLVWGRYRQSPLPPAASTRHKELWPMVLLQLPVLRPWLTSPTPVPSVTLLGNTCCSHPSGCRLRTQEFQFALGPTGSCISHQRPRVPTPPVWLQ